MEEGIVLCGVRRADRTNEKAFATRHPALFRYCGITRHVTALKGPADISRQHSSKACKRSDCQGSAGRYLVDGQLIDRACRGSSYRTQQTSFQTPELAVFRCAVGCATGTRG